MVQIGNTYDKYICIFRVNTQNLFDIDLSKKHWFDYNVEGQRGLVRTQIVHPFALVQKNKRYKSIEKSFANVRFPLIFYAYLLNGRSKLFLDIFWQFE